MNHKTSVKYPNYIIYPEGRIYSLITNKFLKCIKTPEGYVRVHLCRKGEDPVKELIHRLVAEAFIPNPENKPTVNHIDGNKLNNHVDNLEWATHKEQSDHAWKLGLSSMSEDRKERISSTLKGRVFSKDTLEKMSAAQKGKVLSDETKDRISSSRKELFKDKNIVNWVHPLYGTYLLSCPGLIEKFPSLSLNRGCLWKVASGKYSQHKGWRLHV